MRCFDLGFLNDKCKSGPCLCTQYSDNAFYMFAKLSSIFHLQILMIRVIKLIIYYLLEFVTDFNANKLLLRHKRIATSKFCLSYINSSF